MKKEKEKAEKAGRFCKISSFSDVTFHHLYGAISSLISHFGVSHYVTAPKCEIIIAIVSRVVLQFVVGPVEVVQVVQVVRVVAVFVGGLK